VTDRQAFGAVEFIIVKTANTATTGTVVYTLTSSSATSGLGNATTAETLGSAGAQTMTATTAGIAKVGYIGADRYCGLKIAGGAATGSYAVVVVKGSPIKQPQS
jgi:hypothetical protein